MRVGDASPSVTSNCSRSAARNSAAGVGQRSLTVRLIRQDLHLIVGKRDGDERFGIGRAAADLRQDRGARARGAGGAVVAVGDVQRRNPAERVDERARLLASDSPDRVLHAVGRGEIVERRARRGPPGDAASTSGAARYVRKTTPVCARSSTMCRVRSSSLSRRVRSCFLMTSCSYSSIEKQPAIPVCSCAPMRKPVHVERRLVFEHERRGGAQPIEVAPRRCIDRGRIRIRARWQVDFRSRDVQEAQRIARGKLPRLVRADDIVGNRGDRCGRCRRRT